MEGIGVAVIDSGITPVDDLGPTSAHGPSRLVYNANFVPGETTTADPYGHGTHVAGLIAGNGADSNGSSYARTFLGIAPHAKLINLRVLDKNGEGSDSAVIAAPRNCHLAEEHLQHQGNQPLAWPADLRELHPGSPLSGC